jgi:hypothetical protein
MHSFEITDRYITKRVRGLGHLFFVPTVENTVLQNNEFGAQQNQIKVTKLNKYRDTEVRGLGRSPRCAAP